MRANRFATVADMLAGLDAGVTEPVREKVASEELRTELAQELAKLAQNLREYNNDVTYDDMRELVSKLAEVGGTTPGKPEVDQMARNKGKGGPTKDPVMSQGAQKKGKDAPLFNKVKP